MRAILSVLIAVVTAGPGASMLLAQTERAPVFRSGVEVMEVDVTVVDAKGMPVRDLRAPEFAVTVDGQPRRVISAEFVAESGESAADAKKPRDPYVSNNTDRHPGRLIMLVVDRNNIDTHTIRGAVAALKRFVAGVSPDDRLALVTIPPPGPSVDFTTNHAQILNAINSVMGSEEPMFSRYNISDYEAVTFENRSNPIVTQRLLFRACGDTDPNTMSPCDRDVEQEALTRASHLRQLTSQSVSGFAALLRSLRDVEGPKSMIILSQGLMLEGAQGESTVLATLAAEARVSINVLMFEQVMGSASQSRMSETQSQDRDLREAGLETLAGRARGSLFRVVTNPEFVFERLRHEISSHYMLGVEPTERDRDGKPHQIEVKVGRQNCTGARPPTGAVHAIDAEFMVARRGDGPCAAIAGGKHRAADAPVDIHIPGRCAEQGQADPRGGNRSRVDGEGARPRDWLCDFRRPGQGRPERPGAEDLLGKYGSAHPLRARGAGRSRPIPAAVGRRRPVRKERQRRAGSARVRHVEPGVCDRGPHPQLGARGQR